MIPKKTTTKGTKRTTKRKPYPVPPIPGSKDYDYLDRKHLAAAVKRSIEHAQLIGRWVAAEVQALFHGYALSPVDRIVLEAGVSRDVTKKHR